MLPQKDQGVKNGGINYMTPIGRLILNIYSLLIITILIVLNIRKAIKEDDKGWVMLALVPVLVFLANII